MRTRALALGVLVAVLLAPTRPSLAAPKPGVLVLEVDARFLTPEVSNLLDRAVREEVTRVIGKSFAIMPRPALDLEGMRTAAGCAKDGPECLAEIGRTLGAAKVVWVNMRGTNARATVSYAVVDVATVKMKSSERELTEISLESEAEFRFQLAEALGDKRPPPDAKMELTVATSIGRLEGAELLLDDKTVAPSALAKLSPGQHRLEVRQKGFESFVWSGVLRPGRTVRVPVAFVPRKEGAPVAQLPSRTAPPAPPPPTAKSPSAPTPAAMPSAEAVAPRTQRFPILTLAFSGAAVAAAVVATVQVFRKIGIEDDLKQFCNQPENAAMCAPSTAPAEERRDVLCMGAKQGDCASGDQAASIATVSWIVAGGFAAAAITAFIFETKADEPGLRGSVVPMPGGAAGVLGMSF